jgi:hypothetical protein
MASVLPVRSSSWDGVHMWDVVTCSVVRQDADMRPASVYRGVSCGAPCTGRQRACSDRECTLLVTLCSAQNNTADSAAVETCCAVCDVIELRSYTALCAQQVALCAVSVLSDVGPAWSKHVACLLCIVNCMLCWSGLLGCKVSVLSCPRAQQLFSHRKPAYGHHKQT